MNVINELDDVLSLLKSQNSEIKDNVAKLKKDIVSLENEIESSQEISFNALKEQITGFKKLVTETNNKIDSLEMNEEKEKTELKFGYYFTLVNMKNEIMNFNINNIDSLLLSFDTYSNDKKQVYSRLSDIIENAISKNYSLTKDVRELIINNLYDYKDILTNHQNRLSSFFSSIKEKVNSLSQIYLSLFDDYSEQIANVSSIYNTKRDALVQAYPSISNALTLDYHSLDKLYKDSFENEYNQIFDSYTKDQEENYANFTKESSKLIKEMERALSLELTDDPNLLSNKKEALDYLLLSYKNSLGKDASIIYKIEHTLDIKEQEQAITYAFKALKKNVYEKFLLKEKDREKEFLIQKQKLYENSLLTRYLSKGNQESAYLEHELFDSAAYKELDELLAKTIDKKIDIAFDFMIKQEKITNSFLVIRDHYEMEASCIHYSLKYELQNHLANLTCQLNTLKRYDEYHTSLYDDIYIELDKENSKSLVLLLYNIKLTSLHRNYTAAKGIVKIAYELFQQEKNLDLLKPRYALDKILTEYDVAKEGFVSIYNSELLLLEQTKKRESLNEVTNYQFVKSMIKHRVLVATQLMDLTSKEYSLRVNVLNDIKNTSLNSSNVRMDSVISKYMDKIEEINEIKKIRLTGVLQKIDLLPTSLEENNKNVEKVNTILSEVKQITSSIEDLIKNDPEILYQKENIDHIEISTLEGITEAQHIKDSSLVDAVKSLKIIDSDSASLMESLNNTKSSIDYVKAFNSYKLNYLDELYRLGERLDKDSTPLIEELNRIAIYYNSDRYMKEFSDLQAKHNELVNEYYKELLNKLQKVETEHYIVPNHSQLIKDDTKKDIDKYIETSSNEMIKNKNLFDKDVENSKTLFNQRVLDAQKNLVNRIKEISDNIILERKSLFFLLDNMKKERLDLDKLILKAQKRARKDYELEFEAVSFDLDNKIKEIETKINNKYKNPSVYILQGQEKDD